MTHTHTYTSTYFLNFSSLFASGKVYWKFTNYLSVPHSPFSVHSTLSAGILKITFPGFLFSSANQKDTSWRPNGRRKKFPARGSEGEIVAGCSSSSYSNYTSYSTGQFWMCSSFPEVLALSVWDLFE